MDHLLTKIDGNQERLQAEINAIRERMETNQGKIDASYAKYDVL